MEALIVIFLTGLVSLFIAFAKKPALVLLTSAAGLIAASVLFANILANGGPLLEISYEGLEWSPFSVIFSLSATVLTLLILIAGYERFKEEPNHTGEYMALIIFSLTGAVIMSSFTDMFMFFLGLEILSIPIYVMAGSRKQDVRSNEAALKYFLTGSFATGVLLFGIAWLYGATGSFRISEIGMLWFSDAVNKPMMAIGVLLILSSFIFKVGAAPFHFWSPDVYDGAPYPTTGFMASVVKLAAFAAFIRIFMVAFGEEGLYEFWSPAIAVLATLTMFVGNLSALRQSRIKRMLAYSSITHVGYTLLVFLSSGANPVTNLWFYMTAYGFSIVAIITVGILINDDTDGIDGLKGLARRNPFVATVFFIAILSLAGIPPTAGFFGKYMVFAGAWEKYSWLVIVALVNSAISIYYYLRLIGAAVSKSDTEQPAIKPGPLTVIVLLICAVAMLGMGFASNYLFTSLF
jgi:NADH-quinone oxidoreductase subunit N